MKKTLTFLTLAFLSFGLLAFDAEAKRMGGGKNIGTQRQSVNPAPNTQKAAPALQKEVADKFAGKFTAQRAFYQIVFEL